MGDLRIDQWRDGTSVVYLVPTAENQRLQPAPPRPMDPAMRRLLRWMIGVGGVLSVLAVAGLLVGVLSIVRGDLIAGIVVIVGFLLFAILGVVLVGSARYPRMTRAHHLELRPELAARFDVMFAQAHVDLGRSPTADEVKTAEHALWKAAFDLVYADARPEED